MLRFIKSMKYKEKLSTFIICFILFMFLLYYSYLFLILNDLVGILRKKSSISIIAFFY